MAFITDSEAARAAFTTATQQAKDAVTGLFNAYGFTRQNANGTWSTASGSEAFDPNKFVTFSPATGTTPPSVTVDTEAIRRLASGEMGVGFGYNQLTDVIGSAASREAQARSGLRGRGIMGGGLSRQAGQVSEAQQGRDVGTLASQFVAGLGDIYGNIGSAVSSVVGQGIESAGTGAMTGAETVSVSTPAPQTDNSPYRQKGTPGGNPPANPSGGRLYRGPGGVEWQYRINGPSGRGWYRK